MRRVLRQVITGLVSILLDAILQSSSGGSGGGLRAGAREGEEAGPREAGRGGCACIPCTRRLSDARALARALWGLDRRSRQADDSMLRMKPEAALLRGHRPPARWRLYWFLEAGWRSGQNSGHPSIKISALYEAGPAPGYTEIV